MKHASIPRELVLKYDVPGPRYTSYPTVPAWTGAPTEDAWLQHVEERLESQKIKSLSLYLHIPYCTSLCTFCGCNVKITKDRTLAHPLVDALHQEFSIYRRVVAADTRVKELHFGGGTPTWLTAEDLEFLLAPFLDKWLTADDEITLSMEIDPRVTNEKHFDWLKARGFNRISLGVQDFEPRVMEAVNRVQTLKQVQETVDALRKRFIKQINFDLIYGLPFQTTASIESTMNEVIRLRPSRIAFYSYAHVPWIRPAQKILEKTALPLGEEKRRLYEIGRGLLESAGYVEIGMDHFGLPDDELVLGLKNGKIHRNFMGYTVQQSPLLVGLGPSSISDAWTAFAQNEKDAAAYVTAMSQGHLSFVNGHVLSPADLRRRKMILDVMCRLEADVREDSLSSAEAASFSALERDGLIHMNGQRLIVTELGRVFIRNICMALDDHLQKTVADRPQLYSRTV